ncbi:hypothetical protein AAFF_G00212690 [Aldrovandia affinis]|uniref:Ubiquitin-like domain-containing protein n=1 Tax=Aldrovandia affinis TaxID=143900 RepID=A0AAD7RH91_9TELE|nr:hypothetical protein AAFF_G00212690 [Aldrovandia affinis]
MTAEMERTQFPNPAEGLSVKEEGREREGTERVPMEDKELDEEEEDEEEDDEEEEEEEEDEETIPHSEILDIFEEGLARIVQDPLLCDLPIQVTLEEVNSQVALEYGQAMTVRVCKADGEVMPIVVVQNATVLDLKRAVRRFLELKQQREGGVKHVSWRYVWRTFHLAFEGDRLEDDRMKLKDYGIRNRDEVTFLKKLRKKNYRSVPPCSRADGILRLSATVVTVHLPSPAARRPSLEVWRSWRGSDAARSSAADMGRAGARLHGVFS